MCPVAGLEKYVKEAHSMGINLFTGYLFRPLDHSCRYAVDAHLTTNVMHSRLKYYLKLLGKDQVFYLSILSFTKIFVHW